MPIYKLVMHEARWGAISHTVNACAAHSSPENLLTCHLIYQYSCAVIANDSICKLIYAAFHMHCHVTFADKAYCVSDELGRDQSVVDRSSFVRR